MPTQPVKLFVVLLIKIHQQCYLCASSCWTCSQLVSEPTWMTVSHNGLKIITLLTCKYSSFPVLVLSHAKRIGRGIHLLLQFAIIWNLESRFWNESPFGWVWYSVLILITSFRMIIWHYHLLLNFLTWKSICPRMSIVPITEHLRACMEGEISTIIAFFSL